jgi:hypothetical protein
LVDLFELCDDARTDWQTINGTFSIHQLPHTTTAADWPTSVLVKTNKTTH